MKKIIYIKIFEEGKLERDGYSKNNKKKKTFYIEKHFIDNYEICIKKKSRD